MAGANRTASLRILLEAMGAAAAAREIAKVDQAVTKLGKNRNLKQIGGGVASVAGGMVKLGVIAAGAAAAGMTAGALAAAKFGDQMNVINTIAMTTPANLAKIGLGIRGLATETGADLTDLTGGYYDLLSAGIKVADAQNDLTLAYKLSRGALSTTGEAVDFLTTAINAYGLNQKQTTVTADQFAQAVADGKVKLSEISETFANVASVAKTSGIGLDEIAASYAYLTAQGVPAAEVTTEMNRAILDLIKPSANLEKLQKKTGKNYAAIAANKGLAQSLEEMRVDAGKSGIAFQDLFGRLEGYKYALQTTGPAHKGYLAEQQRIIASNGMMEKQFGERQQGLAYQFGRLRANVLDAAISFGEGFAPALGRVADKLSKFIRDNRENIVGFGKSVGEALDKIDFDKLLAMGQRLADGFRSTVLPVIQAVIGVFEKLPGPVQAALLTFGVGANLPGVGGPIRQVGGGLGDIAGGVVGALRGAIGGLLMRGGSPATPMFTKEVGPGGLGGIAATGPWATIGKIIGGAFAIVAVAEIADALYPFISAGGGLEQRTKTGTTLPGDQLSWPFGPKNTPHLDLGPFKNVLGGDSTFTTPEETGRGDYYRGQGRAGMSGAVQYFRGQNTALALAVQAGAAAGSRAGVSDGLIHSNLFGKAASARSATGFQYTGQLVSAFNRGKGGISATQAGVSGQAMALQMINKLRTPGNEAGDLRAARYELGQLKTLQQRLLAAGDHGMAAKIGADIRSLQAAMRVTVNLNVSAANVSKAQFYRASVLRGGGLQASQAGGFTPGAQP